MKGKDAAVIAVEFANDNSHGYDQGNRWGPDYDCSSLVISIYRLLGVNLTCTYTGNMKQDFLNNGFRDVTASVNLNSGAGLEAGDVLLNERSHAAISIGNGKIVAARINEKGTATGGATGDQTGLEICVQNYYNFPWDCVLRYAEEVDSVTVEIPVQHDMPKIENFPWVSMGCKGAYVAAVQGALAYNGYLRVDQIDGECGAITERAIRAFQGVNGLEQDGIAGTETLSYLFYKE